MDPTEALEHFSQHERDTLPETWLNAARGVSRSSGWWTASRDQPVTLVVPDRACGKATLWQYTP
jgi:hypothetical protein